MKVKAILNTNWGGENLEGLLTENNHVFIAVSQLDDRQATKIKEYPLWAARVEYLELPTGDTVEAVNTNTFLDALLVHHNLYLTMPDFMQSSLYCDLMHSFKVASKLPMQVHIS